MRPRRFVTLQWLRMNCACDAAVSAFVTKYGRGGKPTVHEVVKACWRRGERPWVRWILVYVLSDDLYNQ